MNVVSDLSALIINWVTLSMKPAFISVTSDTRSRHAPFSPLTGTRPAALHPIRSHPLSPAARHFTSDYSITFTCPTPYIYSSLPSLCVWSRRYTEDTARDDQLRAHDSRTPLTVSCRVSLFRALSRVKQIRTL